MIDLSGDVRASMVLFASAQDYPALRIWQTPRASLCAQTTLAATTTAAPSSSEHA